MISSPGWPGGISVSPSSTSTTLDSVLGSGIPMWPGLRRPWTGLQWVAGEASVSPNPSTTTAPVSRSNCTMTSADNGAEPEKQRLMLVKSICSMRG